MAQVRAAVDVLIEADESAYTPHDVVQIIRAQAADVINIKIAKGGGLYQSKNIAAVAEAAGLECVIGTAWGLGVKVAAKLHLAAATRSLRDGVEFTELMLHDLLLAGPQAADLAPPLSDGYLNVPLDPGLGVTIDEQKLRTHNSPSTTDPPTRPPPASPTTPAPPWSRSGQAHKRCGTRGSASRPHSRFCKVVVYYFPLLR